MARVTLTKSTAPGPYTTLGIELVLTAADASNLNQFVMTGDELLVAYNSDSGAHTVTITSVANQLGRVKDITAESIAAGAFRAYGPFRSKAEWAQPGGYLFCQANDATVKFGVAKLNMS